MSHAPSLVRPLWVCSERKRPTFAFCGLMIFWMSLMLSANLRLRLERGGSLCRDLAKRRAVIHRQIGEHLAVNVDLRQI